MATLPNETIKRLSMLPKGLVDHIERARIVGQELAQIHRANSEKVDIALATHDLARAMNNEELIAEADRLGLELVDVESHEPILIHGPIAAHWLACEDGVTDSEIIEAVRRHTTGAPEMGTVAKIVYLADKLDPGKLGHYPFQPQLVTLAHQSLDDAMLFFLDRQLEYLVGKGHLIHPQSIALRNELIANLKAQSKQQ